jgi:outer membrane protein assembly factor BamB
MRRLAILLTLLLTAPAAAAQGPKTVPLPAGWQPEGIAAGPGNGVFIGSIPTGAIWAADLDTGRAGVRVQPEEGRTAVGIKYYDDTLYVAGGASGSLFAYEASTGEDYGEFPVAGRFINDVAIARDTAWFTDSRRPVLYALPTDLDADPRTVPLTGDLQYLEGFNLNGIAAANGGRTLITVQSNTGKLFTVNPGTGATKEIRLLGTKPLVNGDGILVRGRLLYVVQNQLNRIAVLRLGPTLGAARWLKDLTDSLFAVPTTAAWTKGGLYVVNAKFGAPAGSPYEAVRVDNP